MLGILSDRYLIIDNLDIIEAVFPVLEEMGLGKKYRVVLFG